jgi:GAF domain-containing protein
MAMHGRRLDALWKLSNNTALNEEDMTRALLTIASAALRPGHAFGACLLRVDFDALVVEEAIARGDQTAWIPKSGALIDILDSVYRDIVRNGGMRSSPDIRRDPAFAALRIARDAGPCSFVASAFRAGDAMYVVSLASTDTFDRPFTGDDLHFMESLATLLESRLARRQQRARMLAKAELERTNAFLNATGRADVGRAVATAL